MGYGSFWGYLTLALKLSDSEAGRFSGVIKKSKEVPELKVAIETNELSISKAARVVSVINQENADRWIENAKTLSYRELEKQAALESPKTKIREGVKPISQEHYELKALLSETGERNLKRAEAILAKKCNSEGEIIEYLLNFFLDKRDDLRKEVSALPTWEVKADKAIPRPLVRAIVQRDKAQCSGKNPDGTRCSQTKYLEIHHLKPKSLGGTHSLNNLVLLCSGHHHQRHPWARPNQDGLVGQNSLRLPIPLGAS
jgi:hypothetical protein